jgi:hypothetical protein
MTSTIPPTDDFGRDKLYDDASDEDVDYELEPPDVEVTAARERHAATVTASAVSRIDVDELFREAEIREHDKLLAEAFR